MTMTIDIDIQAVKTRCIEQSAHAGAGEASASTEGAQPGRYRRLAIGSGAEPILTKAIQTAIADTAAGVHQCVGTTEVSLMVDTSEWAPAGTQQSLKTVLEEAIVRRALAIWYEPIDGNRASQQLQLWQAALAQANAVAMLKLPPQREESNT